ncbi:Eco57I restriction-modification methylase domain-containing protein [Vibrio splendidus]
MYSAQQLSFELVPPTLSSHTFDAVLDHVQANSDHFTATTSKAMSRELGQVFTPLAMSKQLSELLPEQAIPSHHCQLADLGAGTGMLSVCVAAKIATTESAPALSIMGFETDRRMESAWQQAWQRFEACGQQAIEQALYGDFTEQAASLLRTGTMANLPKPRIIQTNPPYQKLRRDSELSQTLRDAGIPVTNLYAAFVALGVCWLEEGGELLAILPRSFASGDYFKPFRAWLSERMSIEHVVLYRSRTNFKNVLQESVLVRMTKKPEQSTSIRITVADTPTDPKPEYDLLMPASNVLSQQGWWLPRGAADIEHINRNRLRPNTLASKGITMSTGKVELHRLKGSEMTTLLYAKDFDGNGAITWGETRKPRYVTTVEAQRLTLPASGGFVGLKRISANDGPNPQRLFPVVLTQATLGMEEIAIENHVQILSRNGDPFTEQDAHELAAMLASVEANSVVRSFSGTTQINKSDLATLRLN